MQTIYGRGDIVSVEKKTIDVFLERSSNILGVENTDYDFTIAPLPPELVFYANAVFDGENNVFLVPDKINEAYLFHECSHLVSRTNGFMTTENVFHHYLLEETLAEKATSEEYGFNSMLDSLDILYKQFNPLMSFYGDPIEFGKEVHLRQREMEKKYFCTKDLDEASKDFTKLYQYVKDLDKASFVIRSAIRGLAIGNAIALDRCGETAQGTFSHIMQETNNGMGSAKIYFGMVSRCKEGFSGNGLR
jgi:hypothetical protein